MKYAYPSNQNMNLRLKQSRLRKIEDNEGWTSMCIPSKEAEFVKFQNEIHSS